MSAIRMFKHPPAEGCYHALRYDIEKAGIDREKLIKNIWDSWQTWEITNIHIIKNAKNKEYLKKEFFYDTPITKALKEALNKVLKREKKTVEYVLICRPDSFIIVGVRNKETGRLANYFIPSTYLVKKGEDKTPPKSIVVLGNIAVHGFDWTELPSNDPLFKKDYKNIPETLLRISGNYGMNIFAYDDGDYLITFIDIEKLGINTSVKYRVAGKLNGKDVSYEKTIVLRDVWVNVDANQRSDALYMFKKLPYIIWIIERREGGFSLSIPSSALPEKKLINIVKFIGTLRPKKRLNIFANGVFIEECWEKNPSEARLSTTHIDNKVVTDIKAVLPNSPYTYFKTLYGNDFAKLGFKIVIAGYEPRLYGLFGVDYNVVFVATEIDKNAILTGGFYLRYKGGTKDSPARVYGYAVNTKTLKVVPAVAEVIYESEFNKIEDKSKYCKFIKYAKRLYIDKEVLKEYDRFVSELRKYIKSKMVPVWISELDGKHVIVINMWDTLDVLENSASKLSFDFDEKTWEIRGIYQHDSWVGDKARGISGYNKTNEVSNVRIKLPKVFVAVYEYERYPDHTEIEGYLYVKGKGAVRRLTEGEARMLKSIRY